jgi:insertion element IS1 protein InsB
VLGDHRAETFKSLWAMVEAWQCYFYVTDGWTVYPNFIRDGDQIVSKTADPPRIDSRWNAAASLT